MRMKEATKTIVSKRKKRKRNEKTLNILFKF